LLAAVEKQCNFDVLYNVQGSGAMININCRDEGWSGAACRIGDMIAVDSGDPSAEGEPPDENVRPELEEIARTEREYVRRRLREELKREPMEEEMDEWLRQQTEGH
jgi:hypothetical protein